MYPNLHRQALSIQSFLPAISIQSHWGTLSALTPFLQWLLGCPDRSGKALLDTIWLRENRGPIDGLHLLRLRKQRNQSQYAD